jgi:hypothetical protein
MKALVLIGFYIVSCFSTAVIVQGETRTHAIWSFVEDPFSIDRCSPDERILGRWKLDIATPGGKHKLCAIINSGPDKLMQIELTMLNSHGVAFAEAPECLSVVSYVVDGQVIQLVEPTTSLEQLNIASSLVNPTRVLCQIIATDENKLEIFLPRLPWNDGEPIDGVVVRSIGKRRKLLVGDPERIQELMIKSISKDWFGEPAFVLHRE